MKRKFIYHHGPTNSGKTMNSLQRLVNAKTGIYCAPLKLLAFEIFEKVNNIGRRCDLLTGEDRRHLDDSEILSCTIEMMPTDREFEVAVIVCIWSIG